MHNEFIFDQIKAQELASGTLFLGYFSPNGILYDFNTDLGIENHYSITNPVPLTYLKYISFIISDLTKDSEYAKFLSESNPEKFKELIDESVNELVFRGYDSYYTGTVQSFDKFYTSLNDELNTCEEKIKSGNGSKFDRFKLDLLRFFSNAYRDGSFIKSTGLTIRMDDLSLIKKELLENTELDGFDSNDINELIERRVSKEMLTFFKDLCIRYLGYDSIERYNKEGEKIKIPGNPALYDDHFFASPRVITTSHVDIYERYYNYILMDWYIQKVPKYVFNENTGLFELDNGLNPFIEQKEEGLKEELKILKKNYAPKDRIQFIRK